ncbi:MAG: hypothetical protein A4S09_00235 [Proteobacteria bacterium SG_bin7]|nr:MAG: hypothetical protein A4S09_00235 [Proteobacteria bacterium SG_bin7]
MPILPHADLLSKDKLEEVRDCPNCKGSNSEVLFTEKGYPTAECKNCKFIFLKLRLKEEHLGLIYDNQSYHSVSNSNYNRLIGEKRLRLLPKMNKSARLHEDGAGSGAFLFAALSQNYNASGNDYGQDSIDKAKQQFNVIIKKGSLADSHLDDSELDVLVSFNLLCHLYNPWEYFDEVQRVLKKGGYLLLRTGNRQGFFKKFHQGKWGAPEHIYHYNLKTINDLLKPRGFKIQWVKPAFDSDFPYLFFNYSQNPNAYFRKAAGHICSLSIRLWNVLGLPKDDVFILAKRE